MPRYRLLQESPERSVDIPPTAIPENVLTSKLPDQANAENPKKRYRLLPKETVDTSVTGNIKEFGKQAAKGFAKGALGTYGDILDLLGAQSRETLPGEKAQYEQEHDILQKLLRGEKASLGEIETIAPQDVAPRYSRLPSSSDVGSFLESLGAPLQPQTPGGRYGSRIGQFLGAGSTFGAPAVIPSTAAGAVGQTAEEFGVPPWGQAALEIATLLKTGKAGAPKIRSSEKVVDQELNRLRELGLSEQDLTLAKNALRQSGFLEKVSKVTKSSKEQFKNSLSNLQEKHNEILNKAFPGLEHGVEAVEKSASDLYQAMDKLAGHVNIPRGDRFISTVDKVKERLSRTLANTPEEKNIIDFLDKAVVSAQGPVPADFYTRFYRGLNSIGRWTNPSEREKIFGEIKNSIKQTFRESSDAGRILANQFERANQGWMKLRQAEDLSKLFGKAISEEGVDYKKLSTIFDNPKNYQEIAEGVGKTQAKNLRLIAKTGENISNLQKRMEGGAVKKIFGIGKPILLAKSIITLDFPLLSELLMVGGAGKLATKILTDPNYQRLHLRLLQKANANKWGAVKSIVNQIEKDLEKEKSNPQK